MRTDVVGFAIGIDISSAFRSDIYTRMTALYFSLGVRMVGPLIPPPPTRTVSKTTRVPKRVCNITQSTHVEQVQGQGTG